MKNNVFVVALVALSLLAINVLASCNKDAKKSYNVGVDIQSDFQKDKVQVLIDGDEILNKELTTLDVLGVCLPDGVVHKVVKEGKHKLKVVVNDGATQIEKFNLQEDTYIGVRYDRQATKISIVFSKEKFMYD